MYGLVVVIALYDNQFVSHIFGQSYNWTFVRFPYNVTESLLLCVLDIFIDKKSLRVSEVRCVSEVSTQVSVQLKRQVTEMRCEFEFERGYGGGGLGLSVQT